ncbi:carboxypeptidase-like regulatory domain-containing protein [Hanstruepera marina]|uniref:carboxypeptidase-like regulatory domain-containing protein n=1 Tax=Hanstruepera marina TaxID=2873265 RepID=UPI001CA6F884|nr:carboxypeptidase-like regulatory domain-containing protein [Hanstruepera marina]
MRKTLTLSIPEPCHENWNDMTPVDRGRHCAVCTKTVYDFTNKTDEQIVKAYLNNQNLCGRFKGKQLNKELVYSRKSSNSYRTLLASGLLSFLSFSTYQAFGQEKPGTEQTDTKKQPVVKGKTAVSVLNTKMISGTIADENGLPLPGVNIIVKGTSRGTQTDFDGNFKVTAHKGDTLGLSFIGYKERLIFITTETNYKTDMIVDELDCDNVIVAGFPSSNWKKDCERDKRKAFKKAKRQEKRQKIKKGELERSNLGKFFYSITHPFK